MPAPEGVRYGEAPQGYFLEILFVLPSGRVLMQLRGASYRDDRLTSHIPQGPTAPGLVFSEYHTTQHGGSHAASRFYTYRAPGRNRDHRCPYLTAPARRPVGARSGPSGPVRQQPEADRPGDAQLSRHQQQLPTPGHQQPGVRRNLVRLDPGDPAAHGTGSAVQLLQFLREYLSAGQ